MYQSIDDSHYESDQDLAPKPPFWPLFAVVWGLLLVFIGVYLNSPIRPLAPQTIETTQLEADRAYRKAVSEQNPALRRARLNDCLLTVENGSHENAVLAQLDVINQYDRRAWRRLQSLISRKTLSTERKIKAIEAYESVWGGSLLGARDDDIERIKAEVLGTTGRESLPVRALEDKPIPLPDSVDGDELAGGPEPIITIVPQRRDEESEDDESEGGSEEGGEEDDQTNDENNNDSESESESESEDNTDEDQKPEDLDEDPAPKDEDTGESESETENQDTDKSAASDSDNKDEVQTDEDVNDNTDSIEITSSKPLRVRRNVSARYPSRARRNGVEAIVTLSLDIDKRGRVTTTEVISIEAEDYEDTFIRAAERAALRTRYYPREVNGEPVAVDGVTKRYRFEQ